MTVPLKVYAELGLGRKFQELKKEVQISRNIKGVSGEAKINMALRTRYDQIRKMMSIEKRTVSVILSGPSCNDVNVRFETVPLKPESMVKNVEDTVVFLLERYLIMPVSLIHHCFS